MSVDAIIACIPGWRDADDISIEHIGGLTNTHCRVTATGDHFVLRVSGNNTRFLGSSRQFEVDALRIAAAHDLAPKIVQHLRPEGHLVTRWIDGRHCTYDDFALAQNAAFRFVGIDLC